MENRLLNCRKGSKVFCIMFEKNQFLHNAALIRKSIHSTNIANVAVSRKDSD